MRVLLTVVFMCALLGANAQVEDRRVALLHYALEAFTPGRVLQKDGSVSNQLLNYNLLTGEMIFLSNGKYLAIAEPQTVDTVYIGERRFVPEGKKFYEWLAGKRPALYRDYFCSVREPGVETGFGRSNTTSSASLNRLIASGGAYELSLPAEFKVDASINFVVRDGSRFAKVTSPQVLSKLFPAKKPIIDSWQGKINNEQDIVRLILMIQ